MEPLVKFATDFFGKEVKGLPLPASASPPHGHGKKEDDGKGEKGISKENIATLKSLLDMFNFASAHDVMLLVIGVVFTIIHGGCFPVLAVVFGNVSDTFIAQGRHGKFAKSTLAHSNSNSSTATDYDQDEINFDFDSGSQSTNSTTNTSASSDNPLAMVAQVFGYVGKVLGLYSNSGAMTKEEFVTSALIFSAYFLSIGIVVFVSSFIQTVCWELAAENQIFRMRQQFISQILRQEIAWFEHYTPGYLIAKLADDVERVREGIGHKFSIVLEYCSCFAIGGFFGLCINWKLAFIFAISVPFIIGKILYLVKLFTEKAIDRQKRYGKIGSLSEEVLSEVFTVKAYGAELKEEKKYAKELQKSYDIAITNYHMIGFGTGALYAIIYSTFSAATLVASSQLSQHLLSTRQVYVVFLCASVAIVALSNILPYITDIAYSKGCSQSIRKIIDSVPKIDPYSHHGHRPFRFVGKIKLSHVTFRYPTRQDTSVLCDLSLNLMPGTTTAIVGGSGEGKSTLVDLLLRFYDPQDGHITFDDFSLRSLNVKWLRDNVCLVSPSPLFQADTIYNNLTGANRGKKKEDVIKAAKAACAHEFIMSLPGGYDTVIGVSDRELGAGQAQLLAIARALVQNPYLLILDEAYSALSLKTTKKLLKNLEKFTIGRTTLIISHSVARVCTVGTINVMKDGGIVETGTHAELMKKQGIYFNMASKEVLPETPEGSESRGDSKASDASASTAEADDEEEEDEEEVEVEEEDAESGYSEEPEEKLRYPTLSELLTQITRNPQAYTFLTLGLLGCLISGLVPPIFGLILGELFIAFAESGDKMSSDSIFWAKMVFGCGIAHGLGYWMRTVYVSAIGESLSCFMRRDVYLAMLRQSIPWFDDEFHSSERLFNLLSRNPPVFKVVIGTRLCVVISALISLFGSILIATILEWRLALVIILAIPIQCAVIYWQKKNFRESQLKIDEWSELAVLNAAECLEDIRNVLTLCLQEGMIGRFTNLAQEIFDHSQNQSIHLGLPFAISETLPLITFAILFLAGAHLINIGVMESIQLFRIFIVLAFSSFTIGQVTTFIPDYVVAKEAYAHLYGLCDLDPKSPQTQDKGGKRPEIKGDISFQNVSFSYPTRPGMQILQDISFDLKEGETIGVIGSEGKSTLMSLLLRFYECVDGQVTVDGVNVKDIDLEYLRSHIGYVPQHPSLFNRSIRDNILYCYSGGLEGADLQALLEEVAKAACISEFIKSLPDGYDTHVGPHGTCLTASERQRIFIARAIIRNPKILLLDEPTSALDPDQEMSLLSAIKKLSETRSCILVSKRPNVIKLVDKVAVISEGRISEYGNHEELDALGGFYYNFMKST